MWNILKILWVAFIFFILSLLFLYFIGHDFNFVNQLTTSQQEVKHLSALHNAAIIFLTFILAIIAWTQLGGVVENVRAEFLLRIDERLGDNAIIKARNIIHTLYCESKHKDKQKKLSEYDHSKNIAEEINLLGEEREDPIKRRQYVYLLNFMDFLETISLFANKGYISVKDINDLMNQSLVFFYTIFEIRIRERRKKYKDPSFYEQFEILVGKILCQRKRGCCPCFKCFFNTKH